jgi:hypothetical protein
MASKLCVFFPARSITFPGRTGGDPHAVPSREIALLPGDSWPAASDSFFLCWSGARIIYSILTEMTCRLVTREALSKVMEPGRSGTQCYSVSSFAVSS